MKAKEFTFTDDGRYLIGGKRYLRVTEVVSVINRPGLNIWASKVGEFEAERIREETADLGNKVHWITAQSDLDNDAAVNMELKVNPYLLSYLLPWQEWAIKFIKKWIEIESVFYSNRMRVAGMIDRVAVLKGDKTPTIIDIKTGSLYKEMGIQLAGYRLLFNEGRKQKAVRTIIAHLPREWPGILKIKEYSGKKFEEMFLSALKLKKSLRGG